MTSTIVEEFEEARSRLIEDYLKDPARHAKLEEVSSVYIFDQIRAGIAFNPENKTHALHQRAALGLPPAEHTPYLCLFRIWRNNPDLDNRENLAMIEKLGIVQQEVRQAQDFVDMLKETE